jgi:hypothetical protein
MSTLNVPLEVTPPDTWVKCPSLVNVIWSLAAQELTVVVPEVNVPGQFTVVKPAAPMLVVFHVPARPAGVILLPGLLPQPARTTRATTARILFIVFPAGWMLVSWVDYTSDNGFHLKWDLSCLSNKQRGQEVLITLEEERTQ